MPPSFGIALLLSVVRVEGLAILLTSWICSCLLSPFFENPLKPNIAGLANGLWSQISALDDARLRHESNQLTAPKSVAAAPSTARTLFACNSCRMFLTHSALKSSILVAKVSIVSCM